VVRFIDPEGKDLIPRVANDYDLARLTASMCRVLKQRQEEVPPFLDLLHREESARAGGVETAVFGMD